ncbi:MAG: polyphosphate polymerase domain-containing protein [Gracilimonas sp.]|nr:polyphosphate polymerase domain-containing protein [Gracilimonas sp.]
MSLDKLQKQRFELKYHITEHKAQLLRYFVQNYLKLDEYGATQPDLSYPVHSLYLDSPDFKTYHDTINGDRNRIKLRVRYYEDEARDTVFLEKKRRYDRVIAKKRAELPKAVLEELVNGVFPTIDHLVHKTEEQLSALIDIWRLINEINARPKVHVAYMREAYELNSSNAVRVTFDRHVTTEYVNDFRLSTKQNNPVTVFPSVILEIKFTNRYPHWLNEMTQLFQLHRESAAKYVDGINTMKHKKIIA